MKPRQILRCVARFLRKHNTKILTAMAVIGVGTTVACAVDGTSKAIPKLEEAKEAKGEELTFTEKVKVAAPCYISTAVSAGATVGCVLWSHSLSEQKQAATAAAYTLANTTLQKYRKEVESSIGSEKEKDILKAANNQAAQEKASSPEVERTIDSLFIKPGETLIYDAWAGRFFPGDIESLRAAANQVNRNMTRMPESYASLNDFYIEIDSPYLPCTDVGEQVGWNANRGMIDLIFSSPDTLLNGRTPYVVMGYSIPPEYYYDRV